MVSCCFSARTQPWSHRASTLNGARPVRRSGAARGELCQPLRAQSGMRSTPLRQWGLSLSIAGAAAKAVWNGGTAPANCYPLWEQRVIGVAWLFPPMERGSQRRAATRMTILTCGCMTSLETAARRFTFDPAWIFCRSGRRTPAESFSAPSGVLVACTRRTRVAPPKKNCC